MRNSIIRRVAAPPTFTGNLGQDFKGLDPTTFSKQADAAVRAVLAWDDQHLYVGAEVQDVTPWVNGADAPEYLYARGDTVDLQVGANPAADPKRGEAVEGDLRLSIGNFKGKPTAVIYRRQGMAEGGKPMTFGSGVVKEYVMRSTNS